MPLNTITILSISAPGLGQHRGQSCRGANHGLTWNHHVEALQPTRRGSPFTQYSPGLLRRIREALEQSRLGECEWALARVVSISRLREWVRGIASTRKKPHLPSKVSRGTAHASLRSKGQPANDARGAAKQTLCVVRGDEPGERADGEQERGSHWWV